MWHKVVEPSKLPKKKKKTKPRQKRRVEWNIDFILLTRKIAP